MSDAANPPVMRWIPKGMTVACLGRAGGAMHAAATGAVPSATSPHGDEWPVSVRISDSAGEAVFETTVTIWVSLRAVR
ncbi:DUF4442 domain-containing protein [Dyella sp.]|uniref:DUF4442 domain-containing protein n=1 Tax=Dyella sp. TaxID=1869338 RepID=UPI002D78B756|nr:DUF4442 domain-containing protein [Dyella sp.]HET6430774.1 DUF4442 domain-containing protein [Dyella sp.]